MQTAQPPASHDSSAGSLRGRGKTTAGSLLFKRVVRAVLMVVGNVLSQQSAKVTLVEDNGVIEQFATHASDPALCDTVLPRAVSGFTKTSTSDHLAHSLRKVTRNSRAAPVTRPRRPAWARTASCC